MNNFNESMKRIILGEQAVMTPPVAPEGGDENDWNDYEREVLKKLSVKLGEESNKYKYLIRYLSKNDVAFALFEEIVKKLSMTTPSKFSNILKDYKNK